MARPLIQAVDLMRVYRVGGTEVRALDRVSFTVAEGEFVAIMGASGSGKSTLMAILGCLDQPTDGRYVFAGTDVAHLPEPELARIRSERIGFVFQSFNLLARTSAIDNVALPLFYAAAGPARAAERLARARAALGVLGLAERERNTPAQLSGGQQQRVAIARALINGPSMILADEPTGNLDSRTSHEIMEVLRSLNREQGVTVIAVTHEQDIAAYAGRIITMRDGRIVSDTTNPSPARPGPPVPGTQAKSLFPVSRAAAPAAPRLGSWWSFVLMTIGVAAQAIGRNKLRSALTMLGIFIGVAALIAMVAVGQGANMAVRKQIESLGTNMLVVLPGATTASGVRAGFGSASTLTVQDAQAIASEDPAVARVSYAVRQLGQVQYANQNWSTNIQGVTPAYLGITNWHIAAGAAFTKEDNDDGALVAVLGQTVVHQLFGDYENPVGATILVKGVPLRVVGVLARKGQTAFGQDQDDVVMIPFTTAVTRVLGVAAPSQSAAGDTLFPPAPNPFGMQPRLTGYVNVIYVQARSQELVQTALQQITRTLELRHRIQPDGVRDFDVRDLSQIAQAAQGSSRVMALLLAIVASISLLVGGIGIMNILLVSVTERTREIGIRMAIGARRTYVLLQFLAEAVLLSVIGGGVGILAGLAVSEVVSLVAKWPTLLSPAAIAGGFLFSAAVGVFFGYYPARKAAYLNPIEALRYE